MLKGKTSWSSIVISEGDRDRIPSLVVELLQLNVDILVAISPPAIRSAKQATKTIPIVMVTFQDPVATGAVDSLARRAETSPG